MREAERLHMYGEVQEKAQLSMQMSGNPFILFNTLQIASDQGLMIINLVFLLTHHRLVIK